MAPSASSQFVQVEDLNIHFLSAGSGEPILLLHGWPTSSYLWRDIIKLLSDQYHVVAIDLPGFGKSDKPLDASYSFKFFEKVIEAFTRELGMDQLNLAVHDLGGPLGLYWAVQHMEKVKRLILLNTLVYPQLSTAVKMFGLATRLPGVKSWLTSAKGLHKAMFFGVHQKQALKPEDILQYQLPFQSREARKVLLKTVQNLSPKGMAEIEKKLPNFKGPVQIIYGEQDRILPKVAHTMKRVKKDLPQAQLVSFMDCGHFLQEEAPGRIASVMREFLKQD